MMRTSIGDVASSVTKRSNPCRALQSQLRSRNRRWLQISSTSSELSSSPELALQQPVITSAETTDAKFEVLGAPYSLLSASLSASQTLFTRRGTLVGFSGKAENTISTLSSLEPFRRALLGIPFFYQRISSASPITALISTKSPITSFTVVHLDGTIDWMIAQRRALLAWTGSTLSISPSANLKMSLANWGNSQVTGRGLLALVGKGQIFEVKLRAGESYVAHPSNVVAYSLAQYAPAPYRFKASTLKFQIPGISLDSLVPDTKFFRAMRESGTWQAFARFLFTLRTWSRRTIWGDRLFLQFHGPTTVLLQSRASRVNDVLTTRDVNEIADTPAGVVSSPVALPSRKPKETTGASINAPSPPPDKPTRLSVATIGADGKVKFRETGDFKNMA